MSATSKQQNNKKEQEAREKLQLIKSEENTPFRGNNAAKTSYFKRREWTDDKLDELKESIMRFYSLMKFDFEEINLFQISKAVLNAMEMIGKVSALGSYDKFRVVTAVIYLLLKESSKIDDKDLYVNMSHVAQQIESYLNLTHSKFLTPAKILKRILNKFKLYIKNCFKQTEKMIDAIDMENDFENEIN